RLQPADALADDAERRGFIPCRHARRLLTYFQLGLAILLGGLDLERRHDVTSDAFRSSTARRPARTICAYAPQRQRFPLTARAMSSSVGSGVSSSSARRLMIWPGVQ